MSSLGERLREKAEQIAGDWAGLMVPTRVGELSQVLKNLSADLEAGLLATAGRVRAETFDDLLEHAKSYVAEGRWQPAGVISGVVFEHRAHHLPQTWPYGKRP
jgi:hypothetical protein